MESVSFSGKTLYDDVYGGPPRKFGLSPRFEDYGEIFGGFHTARASSIPLLDLPVVDESDAFFDPRSYAFNYTQVFGAVSYHDLFHHDAWTPADTDSFSGDSDHSANNQSVSDGDLFHSVDGSTSNQHMSKGKPHLHAVPLVYDDPSFQDPDHIDLDAGFTANKVKVKGDHSHLRNSTPREHTFGLRNGCTRNGSHSSEVFITMSDISLRSMPSQVPPPSRPPPVLDANKGDTSRFHSNREHLASQEAPVNCSLPLFDVEVVTNSSAAAMEQAMHRAEAKLRSAKELKVRKKGIYETSLESSHDVKNNEAKMNKKMTGLNSMNDETLPETYDRKHFKLKISVIDERQNATKAFLGSPDTLEGKIILDTFEKKHTTESRSSQESDTSTGVGSGKEETEFFELLGTEESGKVIQPIKPTKNLVQDTITHERGQKENEASIKQEEYEKIKATKESYLVEEYKKKSKAEEAYEHNKISGRSETYNEECKQREHVIKENMTEIFELEENEKNKRMVHRHGITEMKVTEANQTGCLEDGSEMQHTEHKQSEIRKSKAVDRQTTCEIQLNVRLTENEKKLKEVEMQQRSVKMKEQSEKMKESGKGQREAFPKGNLKDSIELENIDERSSNEVFKQDNKEGKEARRRENDVQNSKGLNEACEREEIKETLEGSSESDESDKGLKHAPGWEENEKRLKEDFELEVNEIRLKEDFKQRAYERDQNQKKFKEVCDGYAEGNRLKEAGENKGVQKVLSQTPKNEWNGGMWSGAQRKKEIERSSNQTFNKERNINVSNEESYQQQSENMVKDDGGKGKYKGLDKGLDQMDANEKEENMRFAKVTSETWEVEIEQNLLAAQSTLIREDNTGKLEISQESIADQEIGKTITECKVGEKKVEEIGMQNQMDNERVRIRAAVVPPGDREHSDTQSAEVDDGVKKADVESSTETAAPATVQEVVNVQKTAQLLHVRKSTERKEECHNETPATVVKDTERMRRQTQSGKDCLRKIEEDRMAVDKTMLEAEREREREKDRMAVDRVTFEARERAYAEACERAERAAFERATVEAQQSVLAEARERLEKACTEARSHAAKSTTEARLKAERASVERATAEAKERAMEKLKVERAAFESTERLKRSVSEKIGVCSSDMADPQFQNFVSSAGSRCPYSLYGASSFSERSEGEGESARRCRARLERHRRTAERAAKALAEKNMRDLLAQKERAERNRLAETLDAEVKRWSSGKEGNLRALLSTLQYILGPDCGWQPIPLTEVITSAAVKKAYRKATLCVHPDKLQQRGANIQQKYICEKVFDLLKEAWNKFHSEER